MRRINYIDLNGVCRRIRDDLILLRLSLFVPNFVLVGSILDDTFRNSFVLPEI